MLPNEKDHPSYTPIISVESKSIDKGRQGLLVSAKVRCIVACAECSKLRCVYSHSKPSTVVLLAIKHVRESKLYTCDGPLFQKTSPYFETVVVDM